MDVEGLLDAVVASDRRYFTVAAQRIELPGAELLHLPGSAGVGAGTVVWVHDEDRAGDVEGWVDRAAAAAAAHGAPALRVYGSRPGGPVASGCAQAGLSPRDELVYVGGQRRRPQGIELRPAQGRAGAAARRQVAGAAHVAPDGHPIDAEAFLAGEERRAATGELVLLVGWAGAEPVAVVGAMRCEGLLRMKNLLVRADRRREGIATAVTATLVGWALDEGRVLGTVALAGEDSERIYRSLGMTLAGSYAEWSVALTDGLDRRDRRPQVETA